MRKFRWVLVTGAVASAFLLAACSSSSTSSSTTTSSSISQSPASVLASAYPKSLSAKSARVIVTVSANVPGRGAGSSFTVTANGAFDLTNKQGQFTVHLPAIAGGQIFTALLVNNTVYLRLPPSLVGRVGGGKPWVVEPATSFSSQSGVPGVGNFADPTQFLSFLQGVSTGAVQVGTVNIGGVQTTEYQANIDVSRLAAQNPQAQPLESLGLTNVPVKVFVDSQGRVRRFTMTLLIPASALGTSVPSGVRGNVNIGLGVDLYDYGVPVSVVPPPASEVGQLPPSATGGTGGAAG